MTALLGRIAGEPWFFWMLTAHMFSQAGTYLMRPMVSYRALELGVDAAGLGFLSAAFSLALHRSRVAIIGLFLESETVEFFPFLSVTFEARADFGRPGKLVAAKPCQLWGQRGGRGP